jgi:hypothetical protein
MHGTDDLLNLVVCQPGSETAFGRRHAGAEASAIILGGTAANPEGRAGSFIADTIWQSNAFVPLTAAAMTMLPAAVDAACNRNAESGRTHRIFVFSGHSSV